MSMTLDDVSLVPIDDDAQVVRFSVPDMLDDDGVRYEDISVICVSDSGSPKRLARTMENSFGLGRISRLHVEPYKK